MNDTVDKSVITEADAAAAKGDFEAAKTQLLEAQAWLNNPANLADASNDDKAKAINLVGEIQVAITRIENTQIADLVGKAEADIQDLTAATGDLDKSLNDIKTATAVLRSVGSVLGIIKRVLTLV